MKYSQFSFLSLGAWFKSLFTFFSKIRENEISKSNRIGKGKTSSPSPPVASMPLELIIDPQSQKESQFILFHLSKNHYLFDRKRRNRSPCCACECQLHSQAESLSSVNAYYLGTYRNTEGKKTNEWYPNFSLPRCLFPYCVVLTCDIIAWDLDTTVKENKWSFEILKLRVDKTFFFF